MSEFEYCVWNIRQNEIHRGPWSKKECIDWLEEFIEDSPLQYDPREYFQVRARPTLPWTPIDTADSV